MTANEDDTSTVLDSDDNTTDNVILKHHEELFSEFASKIKRDAKLVAKIINITILQPVIQVKNGIQKATQHIQHMQQQHQQKQQQQRS